MSSATPRDTSSGDGGWLPLASLGFRKRLRLSSVSLGRGGGYGIYIASYLCSAILNDVLGGNFITRLAWLIGASVVVSVAFVLIHAAAHPTPSVDFVKAKLRVGSHETPLLDIDWAVLSPIGKGPKRGLLLRLGATKGTKIGVFLRSGDETLLTDEFRDRLVRVVKESAIAMPKSSYDPKGSFARYNFPGHLDRDTAIALIEKPPGPGEPLPIVDGGGVG